MASLEVIALDTTVPQLRAPQAGDSYNVPRRMLMGTTTDDGTTQLQVTGSVKLTGPLIFSNLITLNTSDGVTRAAFNGTYWAFSAPIKFNGYTFATLPVGVQGMRAYITDALAPAYLTPATGGGAVVAPVFYNGTQWVTG